MNGSLLALGTIGALAAASAAGRRGSHARASKRSRDVRWALDKHPPSQPIIWFHPLDFLRLTSTPADSPCLRGEDVRRYAAAMRRGDVFPVPSLVITDWIGDPRVLSHEGRHRALAAWRNGAAEIPIVLSHEDWSSGTPPYDRLLSGSLSPWLSQTYDDEEIEECGFEPDQVLVLRNLHGDGEDW